MIKTFLGIWPIIKTSALSHVWGSTPDDAGERLNGIQEVSGSIPLISTKTNHKATALWFVLSKRKMRNRIPGQKGPGRTSKVRFTQGLFRFSDKLFSLALLCFSPLWLLFLQSGVQFSLFFDGSIERVNSSCCI